MPWGAPGILWTTWSLPLRSGGGFFMILGSFLTPGAPFSHSNQDLDAAIVTCSFKMFLAHGLGDFLMILGCPRTGKTMKFMQLSFKIKVL